MKKTMLSAVISCLMVLFTLGAITTVAAATTTVAVDPALVTSDTCETVSIMINTDDLQGIGSATMRLVYDTNVVTLMTTTPGSGDLGNVDINDVAGTVTMVAATGASPGPTGTVKFVDLEFCPVGDPDECSDLILTVIELTDGTAGDPQVIVPNSVTNGRFCIPGTAPTGTHVLVDPALVTSDNCETVSIMINTDDLQGIGSATMRLVYDTNVVTLMTTTPGSGDLGNVDINDVAGTVTMVAATGASPGPTGTVKFVDLEFCPVGDPDECSDLILTVIELTDGTAGDPQVIVPNSVTNGRFCIPETAPTGTHVLVDPALVTSDNCETVSIMINTDDLQGIGSATMRLVYDTNVVTLMTTTPGSGDLGNVDINDVTGTVTMVAATGASPGPTGTVKFVDLEFCPVGDPGECSDLILTVIELTDGTAGDPQVIVPNSVTNGRFCIPISLDDPPEPRITTPDDGDTVSGTAVPIVAVDESGDEPADIEYALFEYYNDSNCNCAADDGNAWVEIGNDTSSAGGWSAVWNTTPIPDCCHIINVTMVDGIGQTGSDQINVAVSNNDPMPNITAPGDGDVLNGTVIINATDESFESGADITYCLFEYYYDENCNCIADDGNTWVEIGNDTDPDCGWSAEWDTVIDGVAAYPNGCYMINATMGDMHGRTGSDEINVNLSNPDFCLELEEGWNFVSIPKRISGSNAAVNVFSLTAGESCMHYDGCAVGWLSNGGIPGIVPCEGYWVYKIADETVCVYFDPGTGMVSPPTEDLCMGWNMIGHIDTSLMPVDDGSITDFGSITTIEGKFAQIWQWTQDGGYEGYPSGGFAHMTPGQGYWILMTEDATMYGTP